VKSVRLPMELAFAGDRAWALAFEEFDRGNRELLAVLVEAFLGDPPGIAHVIGDPDAKQRAGIAAIIAGERTPSARGQKQRDATPPQRRGAVAELKRLREERDYWYAAKDHPLGWTHKQIKNAFDKACARNAARVGVDADTVAKWAKPSSGTK
jgi:hypothetical protein